MYSYITTTNTRNFIELCVVEGHLDKVAALAGMDKEQTGSDKVQIELDKVHYHQQWAVEDKEVVVE